MIYQGEGSIEEEIRHSSDHLLYLLDSSMDASSIQRIRREARQIKTEISNTLRDLDVNVIRALGSTEKGRREALLATAEQSLRDDKMMMWKLNALFMLVIIGFLAAISRIVEPWYFPLIVGAGFASFILLNAFHLKQNGMLKDENFLKLVELALLKFFVPLVRRKNPTNFGPN